MIDKKTPFYETFKKYSITINLDDKHQGKMNKTPRTKLIYAKTIVDAIFDKHSDILILLHLDISEPREMINNTPRIHFHGVLYFRTPSAIAEFLLIVCPKLRAIAYTQVDTIDDIKKWEAYCKKYDHVTQVSPIVKGLQWHPID